MNCNFRLPLIIISFFQTSGTTFAPAFSYNESENDAFFPAPDSI